MKASTLVLSISGLLLAIGAQANIDCSDAPGRVAFHETSYSGGPPPRPGMEIGRTEWVLGGKTVLRDIRCTSGDDSIPPDPRLAKCGDEGRIEDADLIARFVGPETVLYQSPSNAGPFILRKFLVKAEMFRKSGKPLPDGTKRYEDFILCQYLQYFYP